MRKWLCGIGIVLIVLVNSFISVNSGQVGCPEKANVVATNKGCLQGSAAGTLQVFLGIPYVAPPVGELRWRAPQAHPSWEGVREALQYSQACPQLQEAGERFPVGTGEDCLTLNIWTPSVSPKASLPVLIYIHGGGLIQGGSATQAANGQSRFDGQFLATKGNLVLVTVNYRLGQLGFLAHPALSAQDKEHEVSGNYGLLDQIFALQWVQQNIKSFGGNPSNVTIFGTSAGGLSVCGLMASPLAAGLFQKASIESGGCPPNARKLREPAPNNPESAEAQGVRFAKALGCDTVADTLACMRSKSVTTILNTLKGGLGGPRALSANTERYEFNSDGYVLQDSVGRTIASGKFNNVPTMAGTTSNDGSVFAGTIPINSVTEYENLVRQIYSQLSTQLLILYPANAYRTPKDAFNAIITDTNFVCPTRRFLRDIQKIQSNVHLYHFNFVSPRLNPSESGAPHGSQTLYIFGNLGAQPSMQDRAVADVMSNYWINFARTGNPNGPELPHWPFYTSNDDPHLQIESVFSVGRELHKKTCDFFDSLIDAPVTVVANHINH
jgi:para-nitrobenzyl esterase